MPRHHTDDTAADEIGYVALDLQSQLQPVASLGALGREARVHGASQIEKIAASIREFGFLVPLIIDEEHRVLAGMGRLRAAKRLGMSQVPCVTVSTLTPERKRAFVIAENRLAELGGWDDETLNLELRELNALELDFNLEVTGFTEIEIEGRSIAAADDDDEAEEGGGLPPEKPVSQLGDLWQLGDHRLLAADATLSASYITLMGADQARAIWTDMPFNVDVVGHVTSNAHHQEFAMASGEMSDAEFAEFVLKSMRSMAARVQSGGLIYFCMDWRHAREVLDAAHELKLQLMNICVWQKMRAGQGSFYRSQHELVFVLKVGEGRHNNRVLLGRNGRNRSNVWEYPGVTGGGRNGKAQNEDHPTPKNVRMIRDALMDCTEEGDLVLDPFGGGGSLLIAAERLGRRARLMDIDAGYVDVMVQRWKSYTGRQAFLASTGESFEQVAGRRSAEASPLLIRHRTRPAAAVALRIRDQGEA